MSHNSAEKQCHVPQSLHSCCTALFRRQVRLESCACVHDRTLHSGSSVACALSCPLPDLWPSLCLHLPHLLLIHSLVHPRSIWHSAPLHRDSRPGLLWAPEQSWTRPHRATMTWCLWKAAVSESANVLLELLRGQHRLAQAHIILAGLCAHLHQLQPQLRSVRGAHLAEWSELLASTLEEELQDQLQPGQPQVDDFVPWLAQRLRELHVALAGAPPEQAQDWLVYAAHLFRCAAAGTDHGLS